MSTLGFVTLHFAAFYDQVLQMVSNEAGIDRSPAEKFEFFMHIRSGIEQLDPDSDPPMFQLKDLDRRLCLYLKMHI